MPSASQDAPNAACLHLLLASGEESVGLLKVSEAEVRLASQKERHEVLLPLQSAIHGRVVAALELDCGDVSEVGGLNTL